MKQCSTPECPNQVSRSGHLLCYTCWKKGQRQGEGAGTSRPATRLNASQAAKHFGISSQRMNLTLAELGWIERAVKGWTPTQQGLQLGASAAEYRGAALRHVARQPR